MKIKMSKVKDLADNLKDKKVRICPKREKERKTKEQI